MSHSVPASICEMEIFSQHLWDGEEDFFSESDLASQPTPTHPSWCVLIFFNFFPIFFQILSPYRFSVSIQMFSLRKYFPHFISQSQSKYFSPQLFSLSFSSVSSNYFPLLLHRSPSEDNFSSFLFLVFPVSVEHQANPQPLSSIWPVSSLPSYMGHSAPDKLGLGKLGPSPIWR